MGRIRNTIDLAKLSWGVLKKDRELLVLPVLSFLFAAVVLLVVLGAIVAIGDTTTTDASTGEESVNPMVVVIGILAALALSIVSVFFNGALVAGAHERFTGGDPTVASSINRAFARISGLVPWALLTATVGLILQAIRERVPALGRFVVGIVGAAWEIATFLVVPAVVIDDMGAIEGLKRSGGLLRETWGENIAARVGFGLLTFALIIPAALVVALAVAAGGVVLGAGIVVAVAWIAVVIVVMNALNAVFQTALYLYATTGSLPSGFESADLDGTFGPR